MEMNLRLVVVIVVLLVAAAIIISLITGWTGASNSLVSGFFDWFKDLFGGWTKTTEGGEKKAEPSTNPTMPFGVPPPG